jgi:hypothetical protein
MPLSEMLLWHRCLAKWRLEGNGLQLLECISYNWTTFTYEWEWKHTASQVTANPESITHCLKHHDHSLKWLTSRLAIHLSLLIFKPLILTILTKILTMAGIAGAIGAGTGGAGTDGGGGSGAGSPAALAQPNPYHQAF